MKETDIERFFIRKKLKRKTCSVQISRHLKGLLTDISLYTHHTYKHMVNEAVIEYIQANYRNFYPDTSKNQLYLAIYPKKKKLADKIDEKLKKYMQKTEKSQADTEERND